MLRTATLMTLYVLAFSVVISTPASAQNLLGKLHGDYAHEDSYSDHDHGRGYHRVYCEYLRHGDIGFRTTVLERPHMIPIQVDVLCPFGRNSICNETVGCPFQDGRTLSNRPPDHNQTDYGLELPSHNQSHVGDSHGGHSDERLIPNHDVVPSDQGYRAPQSWHRDSAGGFQPQSDLRRERLQRDESIRIDSSPPPSFSPSSPPAPHDDNPKQFNAPPPPSV